VVISSAFT